MKGNGHLHGLCRANKGFKRTRYVLTSVTPQAKEQTGGVPER